MRSFFTSSLDKIDPPEPYVNAMDWNAYRAQFRTKQSGKSGNRDCALASGSLNPESPELCNSRRNAIPLIVQNTYAGEDLANPPCQVRQLTASAVDDCFSGASISFLEEKWSNLAFPLHEMDLVETPHESFDLELGLLESVQELAIALAKSSPKRVAPKSETNQLNNR